MKYGVKGWLSIILLMSIAACSKISSTQYVEVMTTSRWGIAIFANHTEVPQAGYRAANIASGVLRSKGIRSLRVYPTGKNCNKLIVCPNATPTLEDVLRWAHQQQLAYVMLGSVNEWDYKVGLDGEPTIGVSLELYDVKSDSLVWSSVGSRIGSSRSGLAVLAQGLITDMFHSLAIGVHGH